MKDLAITSGCSSENYCPDQLITRGAFLVFAIRALENQNPQLISSIPVPTASAFTDVPLSHQFYPYIAKGGVLRITVGCGANTFCPDAYATRAQAAVFAVQMRAWQ